MADIKLTKNELRAQEKRLGQLKKYLPTLQLKKAMLQSEIYEARLEIQRCEHEFERKFLKVEQYSSLLSTQISMDFSQFGKISAVKKRYDNIAGVEIPYFESITFEEIDYNLYDTPPWLDTIILDLRSLAEAKVRVVIAEEKKRALEKELRLVSIRVNLFEKVLIPRAQKNIRKIKVFLGDQELAGVSRAKVAKRKIEKHKEESRSKELVV
ncbi:MAG: V-type ATP synthase subunit D [Chlamydiae bacterium]|nr:V-type ATP synthase subunit D [Chlamydiota bacterium]